MLLNSEMYTLTVIIAGKIIGIKFQVWMDGIICVLLLGIHLSHLFSGLHLPTLQENYFSRS